MGELFSVLDAPRDEFELRGQRKRMTWLTPRDRSSGPEAFYSETLGADALTRPHFHEVDQFQLFVEGRQRLGSSPVEPVTLHYADAHTPYGPITGDETGIHYLTYRAEPDPGARFMPESRGVRRRLGGRHATVGVPVDSLVESTWTTLVDLHSDGLEASAISIGPGRELIDDRPMAGIGRAYVVVEGALVMDTREHPTLSNLFVGLDDAEVPVRLRGGSAGLTIVSLTFPTQPDVSELGPPDDQGVAVVRGP